MKQYVWSLKWIIVGLSLYLWVAYRTAQYGGDWQTCSRVMMVVLGIVGGLFAVGFAISMSLSQCADDKWSKWKVIVCENKETGVRYRVVGDRWVESPQDP